MGSTYYPPSRSVRSIQKYGEELVAVTLSDIGVMARLVWAIGRLDGRVGAHVDARDKRGHDGEEALSSSEHAGVQQGGH
jgi:hypothetical protein